MSNFKPYNGPTKLVIAFDIGTTYSGVSYCILEAGQVPEVLGVSRFPSQPLVGGDAKVPSLLYYDKTGSVRAAGAEVLTETKIATALAEGWTKAEWWKLHLRPEHLASFINLNEDLPKLPPGKCAADILADFIKYLFECAKNYIQEYHLSLSWSSIEDSIEYIFTYPNGWEGAEQQIYRRAIERAGLISGTPEAQSRVRMLTEGEASLHFCVSTFLSLEAANPVAPQGVSIVDAGGGTIDLSMFSMTANPISCDEIAPPECRLQGSVFVTRRASALLQEKLKGYYTLDEIAEITREFDQTAKLVIKSDQEPTYIRVASRRTSAPQYNISYGMLKLTGDEATGLFKESIDAIIDAFEQQYKFATTPIKWAFCVGGLSTNDWLWSRLHSYFKDKNITAYRPDNYINKAVANGAVLSYLEGGNHLVALRVARATYGVVYALPVEQHNEEHIRREKVWQRDPGGNFYVPGRFKPTLRKGTPVRKKLGFRYPFSLAESNRADFDVQTIRLWCYRGKLSNPEWLDQDRPSFSPYCTVHADLSRAVEDLVPTKTASGEVYYKLDYDVIVFFGLGEVQAQLCWETRYGERRTKAAISFED